MSYVKTINEDGVVSDIMAVALDPTLDATVLHKSELVNGFTQTTAGQNALDAAAGKTLNDALPKCTSVADFKFKNYEWTKSAGGMYYTYVSPSTFFPNITFHTIFALEVTNFASLKATDWFIPFVRNGSSVGCMCPVNSWSADNSGFSFRLIYN